MILQLNPTIEVKTPLGDCEAIFIIDYGINTNTVWVCRMEGGDVKHFLSDDIKIYGNPMYGKGWDIGDEFKNIEGLNTSPIEKWAKEINDTYEAQLSIFRK